MGRRERRVIVVAVSLWAFVGLNWHTSAMAACSDEEVLFRRMSASDTDAAKSENFIRDRDLNSNCLGDAESHSTAHVRNAAFTKFAEVGWVEQWGAGLSHSFKFFYEVDIGSTILGGFSYGPVTSSGAWTGLKVLSTPGTDVWTFEVDWGLDGTWTQIGSFDATFNEGIPMGETGRRGGEGTGASDNHRALNYKLCNNGCPWNAWPTNYAYKDTISNWHGVFQSSNHYKVEKD